MQNNSNNYISRNELPKEVLDIVDELSASIVFMARKLMTAVNDVDFGFAILLSTLAHELGRISASTVAIESSDLDVQFELAERIVTKLEQEFRRDIHSSLELVRQAKARIKAREEAQQ